MQLHGCPARRQARLGTVGRPAAQRHVRSRAEQSDNGAQSSTATAAAEPISADPQAAASTGLTILEYKKPDSNAEFWTRFKLAFALKWRRFKKGSFLVMKLEGAISEKKQPRFARMTSMPALCEALRKAAYDPRVSGLLLNIDTLDVGWAKAQEIRRHVAFFRESGKPAVAWMKRGGEKEYYLATSCEEIYVPPTAQLALRGLSVGGAFLRGVLDKIGVEPQVQRIGKYKSAGDQLLRRDMSEAQKEQLSALLDDIYDEFVTSVAQARGKTREEAEALLDAGYYDMRKLLEGGWVTGLKYADELEDDLKGRTGGKDDEFEYVPLRKYQNVNPSAFGLTGPKTIAIVREAGAITGGGKRQAGQIAARPLIKQLEKLAKRDNVAGIVLRIDSPGGDALASDLMWREIQRLAKQKPLVATMGDVAASGGYYMAMAAPTVLAHPLTITGSIGVVTGKFNLQELFERVGYGKEVISRGTYAELLQDYRPFTKHEQQYFEESAQFAYESFRDKAAESRGMEIDEMQEFAQGRVWSGQQAVSRKLVDDLGGIDAAIAACKQKAHIPSSQQVTLEEVSQDTVGIQQLLSGSGLNSTELLKLALTDPGFIVGTLLFVLGPLAFQAVASSLTDMAMNANISPPGTPQMMLDQMFRSLTDGSVTRAVLNASFPQALMPHVDVKTSTEQGTSLKDFLP